MLLLTPQCTQMQMYLVSLQLFYCNLYWLIIATQIKTWTSSVYEHYKMPPEIVHKVNDIQYIFFFKWYVHSSANPITIAHEVPATLQSKCLMFAITKVQATSSSMLILVIWALWLVQAPSRPLHMDQLTTLPNTTWRLHFGLHGTTNLSQSYKMRNYSTYLTTSTISVLHHCGWWSHGM